MADYEVIPADEAGAIKAMPIARGPNTGVSGLLKEGAVIWLPNAKQSAASGWNTYLKKSGYRVRTRRSERDGVLGLYAWAEPIETLA